MEGRGLLGGTPQGLRTALDLLLIAGSAPLYMQKSLPTRDAADKYFGRLFSRRGPQDWTPMISVRGERFAQL